MTQGGAPCMSSTHGTPFGLRGLGLATRIILICLAATLTPAIIITAWALHSATHMTDALTQSLASESSSILQIIDRNLFERYGDVQAFALNSAVQQRADWRKVGSKENPIAAAAEHLSQQAASLRQTVQSLHQTISGRALSH